MGTRLSGQPLVNRLQLLVPIFIVAGEAALRFWEGWASVTTAFNQGDLIRIGWVACMVATVALALLLNRWAIIPLAGWIALELGSTLFSLYPLGIGWLSSWRAGFLALLGCWIWVAVTPEPRPQ